MKMSFPSSPANPSAAVQGVHDASKLAIEFGQVRLGTKFENCKYASDKINTQRFIIRSDSPRNGVYAKETRRRSG